MVIEWFCLTEVIIYGKGGHKDPQWTVWKLDYHFLRRVFLADLYGTGGFNSTGSGVVDSITGLISSLETSEFENKSENLLIRVIGIL
jgi:hypothetical protein